MNPLFGLRRAARFRWAGSALAVSASALLLVMTAQSGAGARHGTRASQGSGQRFNAKSLTGLYSRKDKSDLYVLGLSGGKLKFSIFALGPYSASDPAPAPSAGNLAGTVRLAGDHADYRDGLCHVTFRFSGSRAVLSQGSSDCDFGAGVDVSGVYYQKNSRVPKPEALAPDN